MPACQGGAQAICAAAYGARNNVTTKRQIADRDACLIRKNSSPSRTSAGWIRFTLKERHGNDFSIDALSNAIRAYGFIGPSLFGHSSKMGFASTKTFSEDDIRDAVQSCSYRHPK